MKNKFLLTGYICLCSILVNYIPVVAQTNDDCLTCHEGQDLTTTRDGRTISLDVNSKLLDKSAHKSLSCIECHKDAAVSDFPHPSNLKKVNCSSCHQEAGKQQKNDIHNTAVNSNKVPTCKSCHGTHEVSPVSSVSDKAGYYCSKCHSDKKNPGAYHSVENISGDISNATTCLKCHTKKDYTAELKSSPHADLSCLNCHSFVESNFKEHQQLPAGTAIADCESCHSDLADKYKLSAHGKPGGNGKTAQCWNCHGAHDMKSVKKNGSLQTYIEISKTCAGCHKDISEEYEQSIHGTAIKEGNKEAPTCIECHSAHSISSINTSNKRIQIKKLQEKTCLRCHSHILLSAMCINCHGTHKILSINDPNSSINKKNIVQTCRQCHKDASQEFAMGFTHISENDNSDRIESIYFRVIVGVIGLMLFFIFVMYYRSRERKKVN